MRVITVLVIVLISASCKKEARFPKVETSSIEFRSDSILLTGEIYSLGENEILQYGFVMDKSATPKIENADSVLFCKKKPRTGEYTVSILNDFNVGLHFYVRSFANTAEGTVYGKQLELVGEGRIAPKILDFMPKKGVDGDYIKIFGRYFGNDDSYVKVFVGEKQAEIIDMTSESIIIEVPSYDYREERFITIKQTGYSVISEDMFLLDGPKIISFSPESGLGEISLVINGENFAVQSWRNIVVVGTEKAEIVKSSSTQITVRFITNTILPGQYNFTVQSNDKIDISPEYFEVLSPWTFDSQIPDDGIANPVSFVVNNKLYLCTGSNTRISSAGYTRTVYEYDTSNHEWSRKADFPGERRSFAAGFSIGERAYLGTGSGYNSFVLSDFWMYEPSTDTWERKNDFPGGPRAGAIAFSYKDHGYLLMGSSKVDFWMYDPSNDTWEQLPDFPGHKRGGAKSVIMNDKLFIIGGADGGKPFDADIWQYDFNTQQWSFVDYLETFPTKVFCYNGKCFMIETKTNNFLGRIESILYECDPQLNEIIKQKEIFPGKNAFGSFFAIVFNDKLYMGGGKEYGVEDINCIDEVWTYPLTITRQGIN